MPAPLGGGAAPVDLPFWKMHGTGNDFVVVEDLPGVDWAALARAVCDRHVGVGGDGLLVVLPSTVADRRMRMFNPDGSEAEMCGNGLRCFVKYVLDRGLVAAAMERDARVLTVETAAGVQRAEAWPATGPVATVRVEMGRPALEPAALGMTLDAPAPVLDLAFTAAGERRVTLVSMGNPHAVELIDGDPAAFPVGEVGPLVETHPLFPRRTNAEYVQVVDRAQLRMRVWERGAGETLACGSGACAAFVAARLHGLVDDAATVALPGGTLRIEWDGRGPVFLTGPAAVVFTATYRWDGGATAAEGERP